jgi:hypothetical protein
MVPFAKTYGIRRKLVQYLEPRVPIPTLNGQGDVVGGNSIVGNFRVRSIRARSAIPCLVILIPFTCHSVVAAPPTNTNLIALSPQRQHNWSLIQNTTVPDETANLYTPNGSDILLPTMPPIGC